MCPASERSELTADRQPQNQLSELPGQPSLVVLLFHPDCGIEFEVSSYRVLRLTLGNSQSNYHSTARYEDAAFRWIGLSQGGKWILLPLRSLSFQLDWEQLLPFHSTTGADVLCCATLAQHKVSLLSNGVSDLQVNSLMPPSARTNQRGNAQIDCLWSRSLLSPSQS
jgi:hypothetical protein